MNETRVRCKCGTHFDHNWKFCPECGTKKPESVYRLLNVGEELRDTDEFYDAGRGIWNYTSSSGLLVGNRAEGTDYVYRRRITSYQE